ncbi:MULTISPECIES: DUF1707 domain-containing protein [unclassified Streptomyces]|uniref:DUF1707 SHOCT-like domain-containing protein n=1 Tax=unclassified Streptomyces TaxID=2593676 RepID=UPI000CD535EA|nr:MULTISPECIES: DUF1707 domain-containing protein [unclassified Streptomyces]
MSTDKRPAVPLEKQSDQPAVRASDADRDRIADILREALAEGRLEAEEHADRIERVYSAKTVPELDVLIRDLPAGQRQAPRPNPRPGPARPGPGSGASRNIVAILGGASREGTWRVGAVVNVVAICGGVDLDLSEAIFEHPEVVINVTAICGGVDITVPENVTLRSEGSGILGGFGNTETVSRDPDAPVITVRGVAICGGVDAGPAVGKQVRNLRDEQG